MWQLDKNNKIEIIWMMMNYLEVKLLIEKVKLKPTLIIPHIILNCDYYKKQKP